MTINIENKQTITFNEFHAWLTGLLRGKDTELPDRKDWNKIKMMLDKVEPDPPLRPMYTPPILATSGIPPY